MISGLTIDRISMVGSGRHMRMRLRRGRHTFNAIYFSATPESASVSVGDLVDIAFVPQINEFRGDRSVQMNVLDIRPSCTARVCPELTGYHALQQGRLTRETALNLCPDRSMLATVWRYLASVPGPQIQEVPICLCRKIVRWSGADLSLGQLMTCLDIFRDVGLLKSHRHHKYLILTLTPGSKKADLYESATLQQLLRAKES
jgi:single-stranded-DNA-specific exonuclease